MVANRVELAIKQAVSEADLTVQVGGSPTWQHHGGWGYYTLDTYYDFKQGTWRWPANTEE